MSGGQIMEKMRLLLADDNPHVLQMLACLLSDEDRIVGTVPDGRASSPPRSNSGRTS